MRRVLGLTHEVGGMRTLDGGLVSKSDVRWGTEV